MLLETVEADREGGMGQKKGEVVVKQDFFRFKRGMTHVTVKRQVSHSEI
jgi:hypothetical protein